MIRFVSVTIRKQTEQTARVKYEFPHKSLRSTRCAQFGENTSSLRYDYLWMEFIMISMKYQHLKLWRTQAIITCVQDDDCINNSKFMWNVNRAPTNIPQVDGINNFLSHSVNKWFIYLRIFICEIVAIVLFLIVFTFHASTNKDAYVGVGSEHSCENENSLLCSTWARFCVASSITLGGLSCLILEMTMSCPVYRIPYTILDALNVKDSTNTIFRMFMDWTVRWA